MRGGKILFWAGAFLAHAVAAQPGAHDAADHLARQGYRPAWDSGVWTFQKGELAVRFQETLPFVRIGSLTLRLARPVFERGGRLEVQDGDWDAVTNLLVKAERQFARRAAERPRTDGASKRDGSRTPVTADDKKPARTEPAPADPVPERLRTTNTGRIDWVFLDPGHGGADPGAGMYGFQEKELALQVSRDVRDALTNRMSSLGVKMLRDADQYVTLEDRCRVANETLGRSRNGVFVSIHLNTWPFDVTARGFEVYYMAHQDWSERARMVAMTENKAFTPERTNVGRLPSWDRIFSRLESVQYQKESKRIAETVAFRVFQKIKDYAVNRGVKAETFWVLKGALMPSILIEVGFISSKEDLLYLNDDEKRKALADSIAEGIEQYVKDFERSGGFTEDLF